jgi:hypothetical protein
MGVAVAFDKPKQRRIPNMPPLESTTAVAPPDWPVENDLPTVACHAAIELDNLILDRPIGLSSVDRLRFLLSESIPPERDPNSPNWLRDPTAVVVVNRALGDEPSRKPISTVGELVREAGELVAQLAELIRDPSAFRTSNAAELNKMRSFCLALSRRASATKKSPHDRIPEHRFRR